MHNESFFERRSVVATFGIISLIAGFLFINTGFSPGVTGNFILDNVYSFNIVSLVGILLIVCSLILIVYAVVKKE